MRNVGWCGVMGDIVWGDVGTWGYSAGWCGVMGI